MSARIAKLVATVFGIGHLRPAPGTWGSAAALPAFWVLWALGGFVLTLVATAIAILVGYWAIGRAVADRPGEDPSEIVIDEVAGQWIALFPVSYGAFFSGAEILALWPGWIAGFVFFRLFDIWKPWLVGRADRMHGAVGIMLDDLVAGVFAALSTFVLGAAWHIFLM